jgi:GNAT superfamily N-acetyltransferase
VSSRPVLIPGQSGDAVYVRSIAAHLDAKGQGVATLLLTRVEAYATTHRLRRLNLTATPFLDAAIRLYERAGVRQSDEGLRDLLGRHYSQ